MLITVYKDPKTQTRPMYTAETIRLIDTCRALKLYEVKPIEAIPPFRLPSSNRNVWIHTDPSPHIIDQIRSELCQT